MPCASTALITARLLALALLLRVQAATAFGAQAAATLGPATEVRHQRREDTPNTACISQPASSDNAIVAVLTSMLRMQINPYLFGFSSYIGPVVNLSYSDSAVLTTARALRIGSLRYPGGSPSNHWNLSAGRWIDGHGDPNARCNSQPLGTFTPEEYMRGLGQELLSPPIWNVNVVSLPAVEQVGQIDALKQMGVPVAYLELGNEQANPCGATASSDYLAAVAPVVARTRKLFPDAKIAIIGSWANPATVSPLVNWTGCARMLAEHKQLFDAVTVHQYMPGNNTLMSYPAEQRRTVTLATAEPLLRFHVATVAENIGVGVPILVDEYNWGGHWEGATTWSDRSETALRGALMSSYILSAIGTNGGVAALNWYSLFQQEGNSWSEWASCVKVSNQADRADAIEVDGVAQIYAHWTYVAFASNYSSMRAVTGVSSQVLQVEVLRAKALPCIQAAAFSGAADGSTTYVSLNRCNHAVTTTWPIFVNDAGLAWTKGHRATVARTTYSALSGNPGDYVLLSSVESVDTPPWRNGPLQPTTAFWTLSEADTAEDAFTLPMAPLSLSFIRVG